MANDREEINGIRIGAVIDRDQNKMLDQLSEKNGTSKSWIIRKALDSYFRAQGVSMAGMKSK